MTYDWRDDPKYDRHEDFQYKRGDLVRVHDGEVFRLLRVSADVTLRGYDVLPGEFVKEPPAP